MNTQRPFMALATPALAEKVRKHRTLDASEVQAVIDEITTRVTKGCRQPTTQAYLEMVLVCHEAGKPIPHFKAWTKKLRAEVAAQSKARKTATEAPAKVEVVKATTPRLAEKKHLSDADWDWIFTAEARESLARTFQPSEAA